MCSSLAHICRRTCVRCVLVSVCLSPLSRQAGNSRPLTHMCRWFCVHCSSPLCVCRLYRNKQKTRDRWHICVCGLAFIVFFIFACSAPLSRQTDSARLLTHMFRRSCVHCVLHICAFVVFYLDKQTTQHRRHIYFRDLAFIVFFIFVYARRFFLLKKTKPKNL